MGPASQARTGADPRSPDRRFIQFDHNRNFIIREVENMYIIIGSIIALTGYMLYLDLTCNHANDNDADLKEQS